MQRYFCDVYKNEFVLSENDTYHINKVMRFEIGNLIEIVCNEKLFIAEIIKKDPLVVARVVEEVKSCSRSLNVTIAQSLVKEQKMDYILQKSTELGVKNIIPVNTSRSVVKLNDKIDKKISRWQTIVKEASEQSKRLDVPVVEKPLDIKDLISLDYDYKILCSVNEVSRNIKTVLSNIIESDRILIVIGPEGGFSNEEEQLLINNGFVSTSLGNRVLRTETASLFVLSVIDYIFMR